MDLDPCYEYMLHSHRSDRLFGTTVVCYHQTSEKAAKAILRTGRFNRGSAGIAGGGIYFAVSAKETDDKTHHRGVILMADVRVGNVAHKTVDECSGNETFTELRKAGYDSVRIHGLRTGEEIVIYNWDQVLNVRRHNLASTGIETFSAQVPAGARAGNKLELTSPNGVTCRIVVPVGVAPGATLTVNMPSDFLVEVPTGAKAGATLELTSPNGVTCRVVVPAGVAPGATFSVNMPARPGGLMSTWRRTPSGWQAGPGYCIVVE